MLPVEIGEEERFEVGVAVGPDGSTPVELDLERWRLGWGGEREAEGEEERENDELETAHCLAESGD